MALLAFPTSAYINASCRTAVVYPTGSSYSALVKVKGLSKMAIVRCTEIEKEGEEWRTICKVHNL